MIAKLYSWWYFQKLTGSSDSDFGHDKSRAIRPYNKEPQGQRPELFYCGDGVSDLSAARETDLLFAKHGHGTTSPPLSQAVTD